MSFLVSSAYSNSFGIIGYSGNPSTNGGAICNNCHSGGDDVAVSLEGPINVDTGSTNTYTITLEKGQQIFNGGLGVSASDGTLIASDPETQLIDGEITHLLSKTSINGVVTFEFNWIAPNSPGVVTIYAAGNAVNGNFNPSGDKADQTSLTIAVQGTANGQTTRSSTVTTTVTNTITSTIPAETVTSTITIPPSTITSTTTFTSEVTETTGFPSEITYAAIAASIIAILAALVISIRKK
jgi:hypothetical protein